MINVKKILVILMLATLISTGLSGLLSDPGSPGFYRPIPLMPGGVIAGPPDMGWNMPRWAISSPGCSASPPLFFNAHGFGFPMSIGNYRIGLVPASC